jgi:polar amino acid transport system permease protein
MNFDFLVDSWQFIARAYLVTLLVALLSIAVGFALGTLVGIAREYGSGLVRALLGIYVDTMRAVPVLVILVWFYFAFPLLIGRPVSPIVASVLALGLHLGAYVAEVVRGGLASVRDGQIRAATALGMNRWQAIRFVTMPQAFIRMIPPLGSLGIIAFKDTAVASVIAVPELIKQSQILANQTFLPIEVYTLAMLLYFVTLYPAAIGIERLYRRVAPLGAS